jgi:hypothetical protein
MLNMEDAILAFQLLLHKQQIASVLSAQKLARCEKLMAMGSNEEHIISTCTRVTYPG